MFAFSFHEKEEKRIDDVYNQRSNAIKKIYLLKIVHRIKDIWVSNFLLSPFTVHSPSTRRWVNFLKKEEKKRYYRHSIKKYIVL